MSDSLNGRKLRPLIPKPSSNASSKETTQSAISNPYCSCIYRANLFALNLQLASTSDQSKIDMNSQPLVMSSRWNPTPEQLHALDEMYRCGIRTPTPEQIQQIAAKLRRFGKIEGKNVFYWFQNHKARERQKRRRMIESGCEEQLIYGLESLQAGKESAELMSRKGQTENWATPSNCTTLSEECVSLHRAVAAAKTRANGWTLFGERELEQSQSSTDTVAKHATWQMKDPELSCTPPTYLLNTTIAATTTTTTTATTTIVPEALEAIDPKLFNTQQVGTVLAHNNTSGVTQLEDESRDSQTVLQLFPLRSDICNHQVPITTINANTTPNQYYEFLPMKN